MFGPLNVFRSLPEASSTHSATAQQSPQGSSMKGLCAVVGIGTTAVLHSVLNMEYARLRLNRVPSYKVLRVKQLGYCWQGVLNYGIWDVIRNAV